jgi:uncharacterized membrane protein YqjE
MTWRKTVLGISSTLVRLLRTRLEIFALEAADEKLRIIKLFSLAFAGLQLLMLALLIFTIMVAVFFWPGENRYPVLALLTAVYGLVGIILLVTMRRLLRGPAPFAVTLEELGRDAELLNQIRHAPANDKLKKPRMAGD